jgi:uncharacterized protein YceH (UPF0502 family)
MRILNDFELRVLGALVEKQIATPDYYPITLNALTNACNQKNHRDPVVSFNEADVERAIESLRGQQLAFLFEGAVARVPKFGHTFPKAYSLNPAETAVLCVLMLRGPQTPGELRSRTPHLHNFESLAAVEETLQRLAAREEPLVVKLPRAPGMKESRFAQTLSGAEKFAPSAVEGPTSPTSSPQISVHGPSLVEIDRLALLEAEVAALRKELEELKAELDVLKK